MIGVLALQGGFELHTARLEQLGCQWSLVKRSADINGLAGLILPGGESSVFLRLADPELRGAIRSSISAGLPALATCAGTIFLARGVSSPAQESLGLIDIDVERNAYGRQVDSFIDPHLTWTDAGRARTESATGDDVGAHVEGVFIRAPRITRVGSGVDVLIEREGEAVLVESGAIMAATFHPELSCQTIIHRLFTAGCDTRSGAKRHAAR